MNNSFIYTTGTKPLVISMPHNASLIPNEVAETMTPEARQSKDTDWYVDRLYDFAVNSGVHTLKPKWSRYYIDLNRHPGGEDLYQGADNTELCPSSDFSNQPLYLAGKQPGQQEIKQRLNNAWKPYHQCIKDVLSKIVAEHGYAILFDAHSIQSKVPRFFDGRLPDFNFGSSSGQSCDESLMLSIEELDYKTWSQVSNGRFKGGYITRKYGDPVNQIHAIQLELSQATYLNEDSLKWDAVKANIVKPQLELIINKLLDWRPR